MASQALIDELIAYYVNLLIIQYSQPAIDESATWDSGEMWDSGAYWDAPNGTMNKAQSMIAALAQALIANGVYFDVQNAYNLLPATNANWDAGGDWDSSLTWDAGNKIAVGLQLDVIGKYVGVDRFYSDIELENYFAMVTASEYSSLPSSPPAFGFSTAATFANYSYNGTLDCSDVITTQNALSDADFLTLIQFAILCNNMNYSAYAIDAALFEIFGSSLRAESGGNMTMAFFASSPISTLINTIIFKGLLPVPEGVGFTVVTNITGLIFGMVSATQVGQGIYSTFAYGFSTCANYVSLPGQTLICSQIQ